MNTGKDSGKNAAADLEDLAKRFHDLWRDQMAATAGDPEFMEMMGKWMAAFAPGAAQKPGPMPGMPSGMFPGMPPGLPPEPGGAMDPAAWMSAMQAAMAGAARNDRTNDTKSDAAPAGATATAGASGAGDVAGDEFERRIAALEQRLDRLEAALGGTGGGAAKRTRGRKS